MQHLVVAVFFLGAVVVMVEQCVPELWGSDRGDSGIGLGLHW